MLGLYFALVLARPQAKRYFDRTLTDYGISIALCRMAVFRSHFDIVSGGMGTIESRSIDFRF
jgi:hypothetical protein